jgi:hypothetical protein
MFFLIKINFAGLLGFRVPIATFLRHNPPAYPVSDRWYQLHDDKAQLSKADFSIGGLQHNCFRIAYRFDCSKYVLVLPYGISNNAFHTFVGIQFLEDSA